MKEKKYHLYLTDNEYSKIISTLINLKNNLTRQGRYTDGVDDVLIKFADAKLKLRKVKYI